VFHFPLLRGATSIGYVNDAMVVAEGDIVEIVLNHAKTTLIMIVGQIYKLGLKLAVLKR